MYTVQQIKLTRENCLVSFSWFEKVEFWNMEVTLSELKIFYSVVLFTWFKYVKVPFVHASWVHFTLSRLRLSSSSINSRCINKRPFNIYVKSPNPRWNNIYQKWSTLLETNYLLKLNVKYKLKGRFFMHREFIALLERRSLESVKWTQDAWTNGTLTYLNHVNKNTE